MNDAHFLCVLQQSIELLAKILNFAKHSEKTFQIVDFANLNSASAKNNKMCRF